ncbi:MAG TPA: hypothetical protein ENH56_14610 [Roseobacter sp.]|uniref:TniQ domain-containing protein n=1 Tax=marine sediment metagenome TaxID=412755 RepID=A0A0F9R942_9ZZZZ|nr:hypothetical protein [Roseobacter sp.]
MISTLPATDQGESLSGYLRRAARSQGYTQLNDFNRWLGWSYGRPLVEELPKVAARLSVELAELEALAPTVNADDPLFEWRFHRVHRDPFCPACLKEGRPWQQTWRHCMITACPDHKTRLLDECERCHEPLSPQYGGLTACHCGYPLADMSAADACDGEIAVSQLYINAPSPVASIIADTVQPDSEINRVFQFLSSHTRPKRTGKNGKEGLPETIEDTIEYMAPIYEVLMTWPEAFDREITKRWKGSSAKGHTAAQRLGRWYQQLSSFEGAHGLALQERLKVVVGENLGATYAKASECAGDGWLSAAEAARALGIRPDRIVAAVAAGQMVGHQHSSGFGHTHTVVPAAKIHKIAEDRSDLLTAKAAMELLGVSKKQFALLVECGAVKETPRADRSPLIDGRFSRTTLLERVQKIAGQSTLRACENQITVSFREISLRKTTDRSALLETYRSIFDGDLRPVNAQVDLALGEFRFLASDVRSQLTSSSVEALTAQDVSRVTSWKHECVTHWCKEGFLPAVRSQRGALKVWLIDIKDLCEFQSKYLVVADLARRQGTSSRAILAACRKAGVATIGCKEVGTTSRGHLLETSALIGLIRSASD